MPRWIDIPRPGDLFSGLTSPDLGEGRSNDTYSRHVQIMSEEAGRDGVRMACKSAT